MKLAETFGVDMEDGQILAEIKKAMELGQDEIKIGNTVIKFPPSTDINNHISSWD